MIETLKICSRNRDPFSDKKEKFKRSRILNRKEMYQFYFKISKLNENLTQILFHLIR